MVIFSGGVFMNIKRITVNKLFGIFDHDILLDDNRITIVIGENGLGKTIILEMVNAFFNEKFTYFTNVVFEKIIFEFDNKSVWEIKKNNRSLVIMNNNKEDFTINLDNEDEIMGRALKIARRVPFIKRRQNEWMDLRSGEFLSAYDIVERYSNEISPFEINEQVEFLSLEKPEWFNIIQEQIKVNLVKTQRLLFVQRRFDSSEVIPVVEKYSCDIKAKIKEKLAESSELSSKLDRTYPKRLINHVNSNINKGNAKDILEELSKLESKREKLSKVGLMDGIEVDILKNNELQSDTIRDVLMIYISDSFDKLKVFDDISPKIELLLNIINNRFKHKKLYINKENGFNFKSTVIRDEHGEYRSIPVNKLSSGEQNELILFYELIFKAEENALILIDEPEISLHISWQNNFIKDLKEIIKISKLNVIIATHSPDIIGDNWDISVELQGVE